MNYKGILAEFNIEPTAQVSQIYKRAWDINNSYILKKSENPSEFEKSIMLSELLSFSGLPVIEYINTKDGKPYFVSGDGCYCLMKKITGKRLDPFSGDCRNNGAMLGKSVAALHQALSAITIEQGIYESSFINELETWIMPELIKTQLIGSFDDGVLPVCR